MRYSPDTALGLLPKNEQTAKSRMSIFKANVFVLQMFNEALSHYRKFK